MSRRSLLGLLPADAGEPIAVGTDVPVLHRHYDLARPVQDAKVLDAILYIADAGASI